VTRRSIVREKIGDMGIRTESLDHISGGQTFAGHLALPDDTSVPRPAVLVIHDGFGFGQHVKDRCAMLAEIGLVAYAPDMYGPDFADRETGRAVISALVADTALLRGRLAGALATVAARPEVDAARLGAIGFCFGGRCALELARSGAELRCVVSFHGALSTNEPATPGAVRASVLVCTGADDPFVPVDERTAFEAEMTAAGADWRMNVYSGTQHGFANPTITDGAVDGVAYHRQTDERSWRAMRDAFDEAFGSAAVRPAASG
jgi:dienelactone hydrolase